MNSLFVKPEDKFEIKFVSSFSKTNPNILYVDFDLEGLKKQNVDNDLANVVENTVFFRSPTYGDASKILDKSIHLGDDNITVSLSEIRKKRLITLLLDWDLVENGEKIPANANTVELLHPLVASVIMLKLDKTLEERGLL